MKIIIENINTNSIDCIDEILGICGIMGCNESECLTSQYVDLEKYFLDEDGEKDFFAMCSKALACGIKIYLSE